MKCIRIQIPSCHPALHLATSSVKPLALLGPTATTSTFRRHVFVPVADALQHSVVKAYSSTCHCIKINSSRLLRAMRRIGARLRQHTPLNTLVASPSLQQVNNHIRAQTGHVTLSVFPQYRKRNPCTRRMRQARREKRARRRTSRCRSAEELLVWQHLVSNWIGWARLDAPPHIHAKHVTLCYCSN